MSNELPPDLERVLTKAAWRMRIFTLRTRNRDNLDFYQVPVWAAREALLAAYEEGLRACGKQVEPTVDWDALHTEYEGAGR